MSLLDIVSLPDPVLRRKARKVTVFDKELQTLIDNMIHTMREAPGVGLAAPQVGESIRLVVVEYPDTDDDEPDEDAPKKLYVMVNPEIVETSEDKELGVEGCLSVPGLVGEVERHTRIVVKGLNRQGKPMKVKVKGWMARIFQHEIDHLDGIVFPDRATRVWQPREGEELPLD
ncbi:MAG TPA: peptide deformylase [Anaerolineaceae bacterium]|jgi:peptide deformylase|nr:peptide deformylase [Longilinea sp.]NMD31855.1 peptide deformylase [Chloroflexota bacterium]HNZ00480.1 peptide deformylase [Anaerolineaceae bacterium]HOD44772.1 peptide deformylase [Anaerolineaceae bacterium]HOH19782.1 peptide deformylase [Anaerolineaceae bacterium]